jgi:hypothetical protein
MIPSISDFTDNSEPEIHGSVDDPLLNLGNEEPSHPRNLRRLRLVIEYGDETLSSSSPRRQNEPEEGTEKHDWNA